MSTINVPLEKDNAQRLLDLLDGLSGHAKGQDKRFITKFSSSLRNQISSVEREQASDQVKDQLRALVVKVRDNALAPLPAPDRIRMTQELVSYISTVSKALRRAFVALDDYEQKSKTGDAKWEKLVVNYEPDVIEMLTPHFDKIDRAASQLKQSRSTPLVVSDQYTHPEARTKAALQTFRNGMYQKSTAQRWDELEMISVIFTDIDCFVRLGSAILEGTPRKIYEAYDNGASADYTDDLHEDVHEFIGGMRRREIKYGKTKSQSATPRKLRR